MLVAVLVLAAATGAAPEPACTVPDGSRIQLELALTDKEKRAGLMFRDSLPADRGMLFPFDRDGISSFWMKNTLIPLDIVWIDAAGTVADVHADAPPCRSDPCPMYKNSRPARAVLLVNAGTARAHAIAPGAHLKFDGVPGFPPPPGK